MEVFVIVISCLALALSAFTFYWTSIRVKKSFYMLRIDTIVPDLMPEFALVNGGNKDLLITHLSCGFEHKDGSGWDYPAQTIELNESDFYLIQSGKAFHCKVSFLDPFTSSFVLLGKKEMKGSNTFYTREMNVDIEWVEPSGDDYKKSVKLIKYGFDETGNIRMSSPLKKKQDLYAKS